MPQTEHFSMQGRVYLGRVNPDGSRAPANWVYDASTLEWNMTVESESKTESHTGVRGVAATLKTARNMGVNLTLGQLNTDIAALATDGTRVDIATGSVTDEVIGDVEPGNVIALEYGAVSDLELEDDTTPDPVALVPEVDYILSADTGIVRFLTAKTGVRASNYDYAAQSLVTAFTGGSPDYYLLFDGLNTVDGSVLKCRGEVHRVSFPPASTLGFIQNSFGELSLEGEAKVDALRQADPQWGPFARVFLFAPAAP